MLKMKLIGDFSIVLFISKMLSPLVILLLIEFHVILVYADQFTNK